MLTPAPHQQVPNRQTVSSAKPERRQSSPTEAAPIPMLSNQAMQRRLVKTIQPKLTVNQPGDSYEQEADRVADQVMRMPNLSGDAIRPFRFEREIGPIQRRCAACEEERQSPDEELAATIQTKSAQTKSTSDATEPSATVTPAIEAEILSSHSQGQPLPAPTRSFFETRFGRDLGSVRVHTDAQSAELNQTIQAYAFTHRNHIWLGAGLQPEPSHLLAHELTHVMQQAEIPNLGQIQSPMTPARTSPPHLQRFAPYWEPGDYNGTRLHNEVLPEMSAHGDLFVEAPVANADRLSSGYDKRGSADLYQADRTVGVYFTASQVPARLSAPRRLRFDGNRYPHARQAAPKLGRLQTVIDVNNAPNSITVGDLKPSHGTIEALEGEGQVQGYLAGYELAAREVNEMADNGNTRPAGARWNLTTHIFSAAQLRTLVPPQYHFPAADQIAKRLVLKQNSRPVRPLIQAEGKLVLEPDPDNQGILNYVWVPNLPPSFTLPPRLQALGEEVQQRIVNPLVRPPERAAASRIAPKLKTAIHPTRLPAPKLQRTLQDSFVLSDWRTARRQVSQQYRALRGTPDLQNLQAAALVMEAHQAIERENRLNVPDPSQQTQESARSFERLEFWTGTPAGILGLFRRLFGRTFVRIADAYERMRGRFRGWLRNVSSQSTGGGLPGAAIRAVFSVLKMAGMLIVSRTFDVLRDSLVQGVSRKLTALIPAENIAELQTKLQEVQELHDQLQGQTVRTVEDWVEQVLPNYSQYMNQIQQVAEVVGNVQRIINWVRWGVRAVACVSPPALGCLWALGQAVLEEIAAVVVQSCWFQRKIAPYVAGINFLRVELPRDLARVIINAIRNLLPANLHDVFADVSVEPVRADEIECDTSEGPGRPLTDDQRAVLELQEQLGEERFTALMELLRSSSVAEGVPLNRAMAQQIGQVIQQEGLSASDLRSLARNPRGASVELNRFLEQLRAVRQRSPIEPVLPTPEEQEESSPYRTVVVAGEGAPDQPEAVPPEATSAPEGTSGQPDEQTGEQTGVQPGERVDVRVANARTSSRGGRGSVSGWSIAIVRVRDPLVERQVVRIDIRMTQRTDRGRRVRELRNLRTTVVEIAPSETNPRKQEAFLEVVNDQRFEFSREEVYVYSAGTEFIYQFEPRR